MRLKILDTLRGFASLAVVLYHYSNYLLPGLTPHPWQPALHFGQFGVQVFFVISGLVIPYAMNQGGYSLRTFPVFMIKRCLRICPPAYLSALLVIGLSFGLPPAVWKAFNLPWPGFSLKAIAANLFFVVGHLGTHWYNFVHWTLAIEFQFYVIIGLLLPLLLAPEHWLRSTLILLGMGALSYAPTGSFFASCGGFITGMAIFLLRNGSLPRPAFIVVALAACVVTATHGEPANVIFATATAALILSGWEPRNRATDWLGRVSYSLYIVHVPAGILAETLVRPYVDVSDSPIGKILLLLIYTAFAVATAGLFYRWVERPCMDLAHSVGRRLSPARVPVSRAKGTEGVVGTVEGPRAS